MMDRSFRRPPACCAALIALAAACGCTDRTSSTLPAAHDAPAARADDANNDSAFGSVDEAKFGEQDGDRGCTYPPALLAQASLTPVSLPLPQRALEGDTSLENAVTPRLAARAFQPRPRRLPAASAEDDDATKPVGSARPAPTGDSGDLVIEISPPIPDLVRLPPAATEDADMDANAVAPTVSPSDTAPRASICGMQPAQDAADAPDDFENDRSATPSGNSRWSAVDHEAFHNAAAQEQRNDGAFPHGRNAIDDLPTLDVAEPIERDLRRLPAVETGQPASPHNDAPSTLQPPVPVEILIPQDEGSPHDASGNDGSANHDDATPSQEQPRDAGDPMRAVNQRAEAMIRHAFSLAQRGAQYSARMELIEALKLVSEALDMRDGTREHTDALKRGFKALEEAADFQQRGLGAELDMAILIAGHKTPALKNQDLSAVTPLVALQRYYTYAQQELITAGGEQATSSVALYGLGRLQTNLAAEDGSRVSQATPQAMVFHQAALLVDPMNYKAANELGVLLARFGQYAQARAMLAHSVRVVPKPESWRNLAAVHEKLGEHDLARRAARESQLAAQRRGRGGAAGDSPVRWVEPAALAGTIGTAAVAAATERDSNEAESSPARNVSQGESEGIMRLIPWLRRGE